ncbi:AAA family ATPase [Methanobrevibacter sp.]|uniref:ATP-binding protein n=1 Tax=Methanobrevibacter sp. TaxID=66852 RepID=UPI0025F3B6D5|nr:AAA family ATPase [Methanobrevibacter sp.]
MNFDNENSIHDFLQSQITDIPLSLNNELSNMGVKFNHRDDFEEITTFIDEFIEGNNVNRYIVLPGIRGVGKTTILFQVYDYLMNQKNINPNQILYFSCEELNKIEDCDIYDTIKYYLKTFHNSSLLTLDEKIFLLIDESHFDKDWSISGKLITDKSKNIFAIFTGSSSINLKYNAEAARRMIRYPITPLNYSQHLKLKYNYHTDISNDLIDLVFNGNVENAIIKEKQLNRDLLNLKNYNSMDWNNYFKFGGFPSVMHDTNHRNASKKLYYSVESVVTKDLGTMNNLTANSQTNALRLMKFLAEKYPGDISQNALANKIKTSAGSVNTIMDLLEKTHLIFHTEPYSGANARVKRSWQYYFATPSIMHAINTKFGFSSINLTEYEGILLETLVGSNLVNLKNSEQFFEFSIFNDTYKVKKQRVDFIIKKEFDEVIPIEVGHGDKDTNQIKDAIRRYKASHGIIISDTTKTIEKVDNVIFVPIKTFSLM